MLYNSEKNRLKTSMDCLDCIYFDKGEKRCNGLGKVCFLFDEKTNTVIDHITNLPINLNKLNKEDK